MKKGAFGQVEVTAVVREKATGNQAERKYLSPMGMTGKLEVEGARGVVFNQRLMLEEDRETIAAPERKDLPIRQPPMQAEAADRRIVDTREINHAAGSGDFAPQENKSRPSDEIDGVIDSRVEFMIPGHGKLPVAGPDIPELHDGFSHAVELAIHEVPGGDENVRLRLSDLPKQRGKPLLPH